MVLPTCNLDHSLVLESFQQCWLCDDLGASLASHREVSVPERVDEAVTSQLDGVSASDDLTELAEVAVGCGRVRLLTM